MNGYNQSSPNGNTVWTDGQNIDEADYPKDQRQPKVVHNPEVIFDGTAGGAPDVPADEETAGQECDPLRPLIGRRDVRHVCIGRHEEGGATASQPLQ